MPLHDYACVEGHRFGMRFTISEPPPMHVPCIVCEETAQRQWTTPTVLVTNKIDVGDGYSYDLKTYEHLKYDCWPSQDAYKPKKAVTQTATHPGNAPRRRISRAGLGQVERHIPKEGK